MGVKLIDTKADENYIQPADIDNTVICLTM